MPKISSFSSASSLTGAETVPVIQSGGNANTTTGAIAQLATSIKLDDLTAPDDNTDLNANITKHGLLVKATAPASGVLNVVGIGNGETVYTNKTLFDSTNPAALGTAAPGTSVVAARRDHVHVMPRLDQVSNPTSSVAMNSQKITGLATPTSDYDASTKLYVDGHISGTAVHGATGAVVGTTNTQTLSNKTLANYIETVFAITDGVSVDIDPANGTIQTWTLGASRSPTASSFLSGQSITMMINDGTGYTITWPTMTWVGGSAPTLATTGYTVILLWKVSSTLYGTHLGDVA